ncbi:MAG TPA: J domain-containing protein [Cyanobacteria bacterium UBA8156]|jgi:tetratricopeptide (TPR) repeat protein|nr:J domain-containing protein [Cyanobacteria bacterium UBA8156]
MGRSPENFRIGKGLGQYTTNDYFAALGVPLTADSVQIRHRYTTLAKMLHPDVCHHEAERACQYFAKLVSPAYAAIWSVKGRGEYQTLMRLIGKQLLKKNQPIVATFPTTQRYMAMPTLPNYERAVQSLAESQYTFFDRVMAVSEQLSELNLFYILFAEGYVPVEPVLPPAPVKANPSPPSARSLADALAQAEGYIQAQEWDQALARLRQLLPQHSNNSQIQTLLGLVYLNKKIIGMAKVSFQQALKLDSQNEIALKNLEKLRQGDIDGRKNKKGFFGWLGGDS